MSRDLLEGYWPAMLYSRRFHDPQTHERQQRKKDGIELILDLLHLWAVLTVSAYFTCGISATVLRDLALTCFLNTCYVHSPTWTRSGCFLGTVWLCPPLFDCAFASCGPWIAIILAADIIDSVNATVTIAIAAVLLFFAFSIETLFFVFIVVTVISSSY